MFWNTPQPAQRGGAEVGDGRREAAGHHGAAGERDGAEAEAAAGDGGGRRGEEEGAGAEGGGEAGQSDTVYWDTYQILEEITMDTRSCFLK